MTAHPYMPNSTPRARARAARCRRRARRRVALRPRSRPRTGCRAALELPPALASEAVAAAAPARPARAQRDLRAESQLPRRRHLAAPRPGDLRRDRAPERVPDAGLGHAVLRSRPQPGLVRVHEPARRADRDGLRRPSRLQLGLRGRPRGPDGGAPDRAPATCSCPDTMSPERLAVIRTYCGRRRARRADRGRARRPRRRRPAASTSPTSSSGSRRARPPCSSTTRRSSAASSRTRRRSRRSRAAHGAETIVGVDPLSLGILAPPSEYGADIVVGSTQPLGVHMSGGGGAGGFIATRDEPRYAHEYPTLAAQHLRDGRGRARLRDRPLRADVVRQPRGGQRLDGQLRLPLGGRERRLHVADGAGGLRGGRPADHRPQPLRGPAPGRDRRRADRLPRRVLQGVRRRLRRHRQDRRRGQPRPPLARGIFGGKDLSRDFPELGQSALYCVTEVHTQADLDRLAAAVAEVVA